MKTATLPRNRTDKHKKRQMQCKRTMNIGTWNVQSWYRPGAAINAVEQMENIGMDITAVQEIRWPDDGNIKISKSTIFFRCNKNGRKT